MKNRVRFFFLFLGLLGALAAHAQINELPRSTPEAEGVPSKAVTALFDSLMALPKTDIHSVVVLRHGKVIGEIYPAPFAPEYRHTMYSCSKTFVGAAVGLAIADNRLRLTDRVAAFFPELLPDSVSANLADMTVRDLLTMTSGITPDWNMRNLTSDWIRTFLAKPVKTPGKKFEYDSISTYSWVEQMMTRQIGDYGYQMWLCEYPGAVRADGALGQYILIVPDKDMVVVITECTLIDGRRQRRLVWNRLLPEVGDQVLAPGKDYKRLQKKQRSYQLPLVQGKAASSLSQKYAGKRILLGENKYGWQSIELQFKQQEVVMTVVEKDGKTYSLPFGYKQWSKAAIDGYPPYSVAAKGRFKGIEGPFQVAGSYAWASLDALQLKVHYVNWISALGLTLCFEDNKVLLTVTENYSSGEGVTFEGTLAH